MPCPRRGTCRTCSAPSRSQTIRLHAGPHIVRIGSALAPDLELPELNKAGLMQSNVGTRTGWKITQKHKIQVATDTLFRLGSCTPRKQVARRCVFAFWPVSAVQPGKIAPRHTFFGLLHTPTTWGTCGVSWAVLQTPCQRFDALGYDDNSQS